MSGAVQVSRETKLRLESLMSLVVRWNPTVNLVSRASLADAWSRHVMDSLNLLPWATNAAHAADLGSGGGFPGLVLAIATQTPFTLIESDARKAAFLREAIRVTQTSAEVYAGRVEDCPHRFQLVTARAFAPLPRLVAISRHLLMPGGRYALLKGRNADAELESVIGASVSRYPIAGSSGVVLEVTVTDGPGA